MKTKLQAPRTRNSSKYTYVAILIVTTVLVSACGGGDGVEVECGDGNAGENWVWTGEVCSLRRDGFNWGVSSIAPALDGSDDLYVVGSFTHFKNRAVKDIARLNNDGSLDTSFVSGTDFFPLRLLCQPLMGVATSMSGVI